MIQIKICGISAVYNDEVCLPTFFSKLSSLTHPPDFHIFVTNNCTDRTDELIDEHLKTHNGRRISYNMHEDFVKKIDDPYAPIAVAWQVGLREARKLLRTDESFTHLLYLDSDVFIETPAAVEIAATRDKHILGAAYVRDFPLGRYLASIFYINDDIVKLLPQYESRRGEYFYFDKLFFDLLRVTYTSAGFMMLSRKISLDGRINFFPIDKVSIDGVYHKECSPEFGYQNTARRLGYETWLDGTILLSHYIGYRPRAHRGDGVKYVDFTYGVKNAT